MSTPNASTVNAEAIADKLAIKTAANNAWILNADIVIQEMAARGLFSVKLPVPAPASMHDLAIYYQGLGYGFWFGQCNGWVGDFSTPWGGRNGCGEDWENNFFPFMYVCNCKDVCTAIISWKIIP